MNTLSAWYVLPALAIALLTVWLANRWTAVPQAQRYVSIDGLRGYLAFAVFLHHAAVWHLYLHTGRWEAPPSRLLAHLGQIGVALFFMITSFLFFSKLLDAATRPIDWTRLYVSRVLRLTPLYVVAMALLGLIVMRLSHFSLHEEPARLFAEAFRWLTFTIAGGPPVNGIQDTATIVAGVTWSLSYEWLFYLALPVLALSVRSVPPVPVILLSVAAIAGFAFLKPALPHLLAFLGGIAAALAVRQPSLARLCRSPPAAPIAVACLAAAAMLFPVTARIGIPALVPLALAFTIIASGNDLYGVLRASLSIRLGETAYSLYLLHGLLYFVVFRFVLGYERAASLSSAEYGTVVLLCSPLLVLVCQASYRLIELPPNRAVPAVSAWIESYLPRNRPVKVQTRSLTPADSDT